MPPSQDPQTEKEPQTSDVPLPVQPEIAPDMPLLPPLEPKTGAEKLSDGGARLIEQLGTTSRYPALVAKVFGGLMLGTAALGAGGLAAAYFPNTQPESQSAAAAEVVPPKPDPFLGVATEARSVLVYDITEGKALYEKNADEQLALASITKIMLTLVVSEVLEPEDIVTITRSAIDKGQGGPLTWGEEWRKKDLVDYTLITSSNVGAEALAEAADMRLRMKYPEAPAGGAAVWRMNALARELGLTATYFMNASGLDASGTQAGALGSARDIVKLFTYALNTNPVLFKATTRPDIVVGPLNFPERQGRNTNSALADIPHLLMGKTGTTDLAGGNLAIAFDASTNHPMVVVVLGSGAETRYNDIRTLVMLAERAVAEAQ